MSCRATSGNSAATSLAKFLTRSKEDVVSHVFHEVRAEAMVMYGRSEDGAKAGALPADVTAVQDFIDQSRLLARHDPRVPDAWRAKLIARIDAAESELRSGENIPNKATFYAWSNLTERLESQPDDSRRGRNSVPPDPTAGVTPEGLVITASDVALAQSEYERLKEGFKNNYEMSKAKTAETYQERESRKFRALELAAARDRFERVSEAYDATDTGYAILLADPAKNRRNSGHAAWLERVARADGKRASTDPAATVRQAAATETESSAVSARYKALSDLRAAETTYRSSPSVRSRAKYEKAAKEYQNRQRVYLYTLLERPELTEASEADLRSPQSWSLLGGNEQVTRQDMWRALDMNAADKDTAAVRIGRISDVEAMRRSILRAEARQSVLDMEGRGEIDGINRRFAESLKRKRGGSAA